MNDDEALEIVAEAPILMTTNTCLHVRLFHSETAFKGMWAEDWVDHRAGSQKAAESFIDQLGGYWNPAFLMALRSAITRKLAQHDSDYGTAWADESDPNAA